MRRVGCEILVQTLFFVRFFVHLPDCMVVNYMFARPDNDKDKINTIIIWDTILLKLRKSGRRDG